MTTEILERFLKYVKIDTQSQENATCFPSTDKQKNLARILADELNAIGAADVYFDEQYGYVYAVVPATDGGRKKDVLGFIAHMDTSPDVSGADVKPTVVENYNGEDLILNKALNIVLKVDEFPEIRKYAGNTLVVTDGTTLLGADDKAGVAEIMTMTAYLLAHKEIEHGKIVVAFTPDEEVGAGVEHFDIARFGADFAYTVDGGELGELEYENFNAASAVITVNGVSVHPGSAKDKMKNANRIAMEFNSLLPQCEVPECTDGYEGFYHLSDMQGDIEKATLHYLIREHDSRLFAQRKELVLSLADKLNEKYGAGSVIADVKDSYFNMKEKIVPQFSFLVDNAVSAMKELEIDPLIRPVRGGTDGAALSFMGLPCPNLCTGGHNFHSRFEYICVESMEQIVRLLIKLACG
ncbi:MAG: peptidase T [Ruminococcaceae bacterium]|nr:peptidase T [Oscillospiraceae bacterium]